METDEDGTVLLGKGEPFFLHLHMLGRGEPDRAYLTSVPLHAPPPGEAFPFKLEGDPIKHLKKLPWTIEQRTVVRGEVRRFLEQEAKTPDHNWTLL